MFSDDIPESSEVIAKDHDENENSDHLIYVKDIDLSHNFVIATQAFSYFMLIVHFIWILLLLGFVDFS